MSVLLMANVYTIKITYSEKPQFFKRNWLVQVFLRGQESGTKEKTVCRVCGRQWSYKYTWLCTHCKATEGSHTIKTALFTGKAWTEAQAENLAKQFTRSYDKASNPKTQLYSNDPAEISRVMEKELDASYHNGGNVLDGEINHLEEALKTFEAEKRTLEHPGATVYPGDYLVTRNMVGYVDKTFRVNLAKYDLIVRRSGKIVRGWEYKR